MTFFDWAIVLGIISLVFGYAYYQARKTKSDVDWFLGARALPFWIVGLSMFATSVDGGDYVTINGMTYDDGLPVFTNWWLGMLVGGIVAAWLVVPPIYRAGMFTNAEYLEARFGVSVRVISVLVQIQYRGNILANIGIALFYTLTTVAKIDGAWAWTIVVGFAAATALYAAWGGLKTIASIDVLLSVVMIVAGLLLWWIIWQEVGGWSGAYEKIAQQESVQQAERHFHIGQQRPGQSHPLVAAMAWILIGVSYAVVNHTQVMKLLGARSLWDVKMGVLVAAVTMGVVMYFVGTLGLFGRALMPGLERGDTIFPTLVDRYLAVGLKGLVVSGVVAAAISSYEGFGAALSALFTRDLYARLFVRDAPDRHYLTVSRIATLVIIALSFLYIPLIFKAENMVIFYVLITKVFVTPLMTVYVMGAMTRVHRRSGLVGLVCGMIFGLVVALFGVGARGFGVFSDWYLEHIAVLPFWLSETFVAYIWAVVVTAAAMILASFVFGWEKKTELTAPKTGGWLERSREELPEILPTPFISRGHRVPLWASPTLWAVVALGVETLLVFYVFW